MLIISVSFKEAAHQHDWQVLRQKLVQLKGGRREEEALISGLCLKVVVLVNLFFDVGSFRNCSVIETDVELIVMYLKACKGFGQLIHTFNSAHAHLYNSNTWCLCISDYCVFMRNLPIMSWTCCHISFFCLLLFFPDASLLSVQLLLKQLKPLNWTH